MSNKNKKSKTLNETDVDPFEELNEFDEELTIETEKDFFDELEQSDIDDVPKYDSEHGTIIEGSEPNKQIKTKDNKIVKEKISLIETIEEVDVNNTQKRDAKTNVKEINTNKDMKKNSMSKPKKKLNSKKSSNDDTQIIDNVKVDSDGVPLLNQFDTEKIKESNLLPKFTIRRVSLTKIFMIIVGLIISIIGILQAMNEVIKVSDHVMYGEHESFAIGLIFLGIIIIILAFYKEIMKLAGLGNLNNVMEDVNSSNDNNKNNKSKK